MSSILNKHKNLISCKITTKLLIIYAIQSIGGGIAFYISLFLKSNTTLDFLHISMVISATSIGNIIGSYIGGYISDRYNPAYGLKIGLGVQGLALLCLVFITDFYSIFLIMTMMGIGSYLYITSSNYVLNSKFNSSEQNRVKIISNQNIISNIGMFLAAILMGYCAAGYYSVIFISVALLVLIIALKLKPFDKEYYCNSSQDKQTETPIGISNAYYLIGLVAIGLLGIIFSLHKMGYPLFLESNFGNIYTGYLMSLNPLIIIFFQGLIIKKSAKLNEFLVLGAGFVLLGVSFLILNYPTNIAMIFLSCLVMTVGEILSTTYAQSITFGYAPARIRGRVLGLYRSIFSFTKIIGSYIAGALITYTSYGTLWDFCVLIGLLGGLVTLIIVFNTKPSLVHNS